MTVTSAVHSVPIDEATIDQAPIAGAPVRGDRSPVLFDPPAAPASPMRSTPVRSTPAPTHPRQVRQRRDAQPLPQHRRTVSPPSPPIPQAARDLLIDASRGLGRAIRSTTPADRYAAAHLAALRGAAAVLAAKARPVRGRRGSAWELLTKVAPEFAEWAAFFAAGSAKRQAAEAGLTRLVAAREADDMLRQVSAFLDLVEEALAPADDRRPNAW